MNRQNSFSAKGAFSISFAMAVILFVLGSLSAQASQPQSSGWIWQNGNNYLWTADSSSVPGSRYGAASSTDSSGNFWLFGGEGDDSSDNPGLLNDLWVFTPSSQQWTNASGSMVANDYGNGPGSRWQATMWTDQNGNVWLFGGQGMDSNGVKGYLNDLWEFTPLAGAWTMVSGSSTVPDAGGVGGQTGVYGDLQQPDSNSLPGGRYGAVGWTDSSGNLWLFGGNGYDSASNVGSLNDLWEFIPSSGQWTWMGGSDTLPCSNGCGQPGVYMASGVPIDAPSASYIPGGRYNATAWVDSSGTFWLFGGNGFDVDGYSGGLDDLWEFSPTSLEWTWIGHGILFNTDHNSNTGIYGVAGVASDSNLPGGRDSANAWLDANGNLWIFGGEGYDSQGNFGNLNDLWQYSFSTGQWAWMGGASTVPNNSNGVPGVYGNLGAWNVANTPGGRFSASGWTDASGNLWLFGGQGVDGSGNYGLLNDLWEYQSPNSSSTVDTPTFDPPAGIYLPGQSVTLGDTTPGAAIYYTTDGSIPTETPSDLYSGAITVDTSETISAIAVLNGVSSLGSSATYTIEVPAATPTFSVASGSYSFSPVVTISSATPNATIYYTTDGTTASPSNYEGMALSPIILAVDATQTISAMAVAPGYFSSSVSTASYTIPVNQPEAWAFIRGGTPDYEDYLDNSWAVYGEQGVSSPYNDPGACSQSPATWTDQQGNLWVFGCNADDFTGLNNSPNAVWRYSPATNEWTWMQGAPVGPYYWVNSAQENHPHVLGIYGSQGVASPSNMPPPRGSMNFAADSNGNLWFLGGVGDGVEATGGFHNDLWTFNSSTQEWTWMSGSDTVVPQAGCNLIQNCIYKGQTGVYGTLGMPAEGNVPGGRTEGVAWVDKNGNFWLFGGNAYDSAGVLGYPNDLWEYSPSSNLWTWVSGGSTLANATGVYMTGTWGTMGEESSANTPGGRTDAARWVDSAGNLWLFGGWGSDAAGNLGYLNDLWEFDVSTRQWVWMGGGSTLSVPGGLPGHYGALGVPGAANIPGGREDAVTWTDFNGNLWIYGGVGIGSVEGGGYLGDMWMYNVSTNLWTWMVGDKTVYPAYSVYATAGVAAPGNTPGARDGSGAWVDNNGNFWIFGGLASTTFGGFGYLHDLWEAPISGSMTPTKTIPTLNWATPAAIVYGTALDSTQLDAQATWNGATVAGNYVYQPAAGTVPNAGTASLGVTFNPANTSDYTSANGGVSLSVDQAPLSVTANSLTTAYGSTIPTLTGTLAGVVNGDNIIASYSTTAPPASPPGNYPITATLNDPSSRLSNYSVTNVAGTLTITQASTTLSLAAQPNPSSYGAKVTLTAAASSAGTGAAPTGLVSFYNGGISLGSAPLNSGVAVLSTVALPGGSDSLTASYSGDTNYLAASTASAYNETVNPIAQAITFVPVSSPQWVNGTLPLTATASSGLEITFTSLTPNLCTIVSGSTSISGGTTTATALLSTKTGTCTIQAAQAGNANYLAATPVMIGFSVKKPQTINFAAVSSPQQVGTPVGISATASSGLKVTFASQTSGVCTIQSGSTELSSGTTTATVTLSKAGTCTINATQAGNSKYAAAQAVTQSFSVAP